MKIINILTVLGILAFSPTNACENCGCRSQSSNKASHTHIDNTTTNNINAQKSDIQWKATKIGGEHEGNIEIRSGHLHFENETLNLVEKLGLRWEDNLKNYSKNNRPVHTASVLQVSGKIEKNTGRKKI